MSLRKKVRGFWISCQRELFSLMDEVLGPVTGRHKKLLMVLEMVNVECLLPRVPEDSACREVFRDAGARVRTRSFGVCVGGSG